MLLRRFIVLAFMAITTSPLLARDKTDVIYFTNGDVIHCEIKKLERGKLTVKSIGFGTISIEWDKIAQLESTHPYQLELQSGIKYLGDHLSRRGIWKGRDPKARGNESSRPHSRRLHQARRGELLRPDRRVDRSRL